MPSPCHSIIKTKVTPPSKIPLPAAAERPRDTDRIAWHESNEMLGWSGKPRELSEDDVREIRHGYLAAIS